MTIFKTGNQVRSFTFFCMLNFSLSLSLSLTHIYSLFSIEHSNNFIFTSSFQSFFKVEYELGQNEKFEKLAFYLRTCTLKSLL